MERRLFDSIHNADGISLISTGAALGIQWGPIYWGLIGAVGGFIIGLLIDLFYYKVIKKHQRLLRGNISDVIPIVECEENQSDTVEDILWHHFAYGTARVQ